MKHKELLYGKRVARSFKGLQKADQERWADTQPRPKLKASQSADSCEAVNKMLSLNVLR